MNFYTRDGFLKKAGRKSKVVKFNNETSILQLFPHTKLKNDRSAVFDQEEFEDLYFRYRKAYDVRSSILSSEKKVKMSKNKIAEQLSLFKDCFSDLSNYDKLQNLLKALIKSNPFLMGEVDILFKRPDQGDETKNGEYRDSLGIVIFDGGEYEENVNIDNIFAKIFTFAHEYRHYLQNMDIDLTNELYYKSNEPYYSFNDKSNYNLIYNILKTINPESSDSHIKYIVSLIDFDKYRKQFVEIDANVFACKFAYILFDIWQSNTQDNEIIRVCKLGKNFVMKKVSALSKYIESMSYNENISALFDTSINELTNEQLLRLILKNKEDLLFKINDVFGEKIRKLRDDEVSDLFDYCIMLKDKILFSLFAKCLSVEQEKKLIEKYYKFLETGTFVDDQDMLDLVLDRLNNVKLREFMDYDRFKNIFKDRVLNHNFDIAEMMVIMSIVREMIAYSDKDKKELLYLKDFYKTFIPSESEFLKDIKFMGEYEAFLYTKLLLKIMTFTNEQAPNWIRLVIEDLDRNYTNSQRDMFYKKYYGKNAQNTNENTRLILNKFSNDRPIAASMNYYCDVLKNVDKKPPMFLYLSSIANHLNWGIDCSQPMEDMMEEANILFLLAKKRFVGIIEDLSEKEFKEICDYSLIDDEGFVLNMLLQDGVLDRDTKNEIFTKILDELRFNKETKNYLLLPKVVDVLSKECSFRDVFNMIVSSYNNSNYQITIDLFKLLLKMSNSEQINDDGIKKDLAIFINNRIVNDFVDYTNDGLLSYGCDFEPNGKTYVNFYSPLFKVLQAIEKEYKLDLNIKKMKYDGEYSISLPVDLLCKHIYKKSKDDIKAEYRKTIERIQKQSFSYVSVFDMGAHSVEK